MSKQLMLTCKEAANDKLVVSADGADVKLNACNAVDDLDIYLDADSARQLFNWLGVWLHGGNRT